MTRLRYAICTALPIVCQLKRLPHAGSLDPSQWRVRVGRQLIESIPRAKEKPNWVYGQLETVLVIWRAEKLMKLGS